MNGQDTEAPVIFRVPAATIDRSVGSVSQTNRSRLAGGRLSAGLLFLQPLQPLRDRLPQQNRAQHLPQLQRLIA